MFANILASPFTPPLFQTLLGGLVLSLFNFWTDSQKPKSHRIEKDWIYWFFFGMWPIIGAILSYIYIVSGYKIDGLLAFTLGLTAPTTIQTMIQKAAHTEQPPRNAEP
jgi:hypothetical protein